ncbi:MAG: chemotaxis-specific protein-glutamate methyltransferase CheB [Polyangia bacterium]
MAKLRVLIAEDSQVIQRTLAALLEGESGIEVVGTAGTGEEALAICREQRPDLVTMDIFMPEMDGLEATRRIMEECPTRIVIISSMVGSDDQRMSFEAMRAGAVEVIAKPHGVLAGNYAQVRADLSRVLRRIEAARPARQLAWQASIAPPPPLATPEPSRPRPVAAPGPAPGARSDSRFAPQEIPEGFSPAIVGIGGSTGAPAVLVEVLSALPASFRVPIVVAQHIAFGFANGMADWLNASVALEVAVARTGDELRPGRVLIAPDDRHLEIKSGDRVVLRPSQRAREHVPSVDRFFSSLAGAGAERALGVILSGMGGDGARGLGELREAGGITLAQDEQSCVVHGMPGKAVELGAVMQEVSPESLAELLAALGQRAESS